LTDTIRIEHFENAVFIDEKGSRVTLWLV